MTDDPSIIGDPWTEHSTDMIKPLNPEEKPIWTIQAVASVLRGDIETTDNTIPPEEALDRAADRLQSIREERDEAMNILRAWIANANWIRDRTEYATMFFETDKADRQSLVGQTREILEDHD